MRSRSLTVGQLTAALQPSLKIDGRPMSCPINGRPITLNNSHLVTYYLPGYGERVNLISDAAYRELPLKLKRQFRLSSLDAGEALPTGTVH